MYTVKVISSTVRPGRRGPFVAKWVVDQLNKTEHFKASLIDLGEWDLPLMNEAHHPRLRKYEHEHTKRFSAAIEEADAFVMVTAEYDNTYPAPLKNALEYLVFEWHHKPSGIVSYSGGNFAGIRAAKVLKDDLLSKKIIPLMETVHIPNIDSLIHEGEFKANELIEKNMHTLSNALLKWSKSMETLRKS